MVCAWIAGAWRGLSGEIGTIKNPTRVESGLAGFVRRMFFIYAGREFKNASPSPSRCMPPCAYDRPFKGDVFGGDVCGAIHLCAGDGCTAVLRQARNHRRPCASLYAGHLQTPARNSSPNPVIQLVGIPVFS
jgi:hypothetical protein